jgi:biuret amidohydrolase
MASTWVRGRYSPLQHFARQRQRLVKPHLVELVASAHTAVVTQEMQGAVMGPTPVSPCWRPDGLGSNHNARLFAGAAMGVDVTPGSEGATLLPEAGPEASDVVLTRWHGIGPMGGTDLDAILRNLGVSTIVAVGVSLNIAIPHLVMDAVNKGYRVVLPRDAVAGYPAEYGTAVIDNSLSLLATVTSTDELLATWR